MLLGLVSKEPKELANYEYEKEVFGFYLSDSPFDKYSVKPFEEFQDGQFVSTIVEITSLATRYDKNGNEMAFATGVNNTDAIKLVFFATFWGKTKCEEGQIALLKGRKDNTSLIVNSVEVLE